MRQTRLSLNNNMTRVDRVFLTTGSCCAREFLAKEHPGLIVLIQPARTAHGCSTNFRRMGAPTRCSSSIRWAT